MNVPLRILAVAAVLSAALTALPAAAAPADSSIAVTQEGKFSAKNVLVMQRAGSAFFARLRWGEAFVRLTVLIPTTGSPISITKNHGGAATIDDIRAGDLINVEGALASGSDTLFVNASRVVDLSVNREAKTLAGTIKSVGSGVFVLPNKLFGDTTVVVGTSTITKGVRTISAADLAAKDKVLSAVGIYDYAQNTLAADAIVIYQDKSVFNARNFEGVVRSIAGTTLPASLIIDTASESYTVYLPASARVLSKNRAAVSLSRFAAGDKVRVYGAIRQDNLANIDASVIRDLNF